MKLPRTFIILALALTGSLGARAQSSNQVPDPTDYAAFSRFIAERNIFDPNRQPHFSNRPQASRTHTHSPSAPAFSLVGTMAYEKGYFAFFNGNSDELRQALPVSGTIAGYTVADISYGHVTLETTNAATNATGKVELKVGDVMREENGQWQFAGAGDISTGSRSVSSSSTPATSSSSTPAPSSSASEPNDILKRLMQKREQENQ